MRTLLCLGCLAGCGGDGSCTPEGQEISGIDLVVDRVDDVPQPEVFGCNYQLIRSSDELTEALRGNEPSPQIAAVDFTVDRLVFGTVDPSLQFTIDDGSQIVLGLFDIGLAQPRTCVGYIVRQTTRDSVVVDYCNRPGGG